MKNTTTIDLNDELEDYEFCILYGRYLSRMLRRKIRGQLQYEFQHLCVKAESLSHNFTISDGSKSFDFLVNIFLKLDEEYYEVFIDGRKVKTKAKLLEMKSMIYEVFDEFCLENGYDSIRRVKFER